MPRKRTVREGVEVVQVQKAGRRNNGHVEVLDGDASDRDEDEDGDDDEGGEEERVEIGDDGEADEMMIRRKYQIPEKVIQMDFVRKVRAAGGKGKDVEGPVVQVSISISCYTMGGSGFLFICRWRNRRHRMLTNTVVRLDA